jgi:cupin fold WbuC family metalloprotein
MDNDKYHWESNKVLYTRNKLTIINQSDIADFKQLAINNNEGRSRLCSHLDKTDLLHEMLIVHKKNTYVRPHKHCAKTESIHIIEGLVDILLFDDRGNIDSIIKMGDYRSGLPFYFRLNDEVFHTLIIRSEFVVFHETTHGPLKPESTVYAQWAPKESLIDSVFKYMRDLDMRAKEI